MHDTRNSIFSSLMALALSAAILTGASALTASCAHRPHTTENAK